MPTDSHGLTTSSERAGNIEASVFPPAVGARTTAFLPSRIASPASSCTGRSAVQPRRETIASCSRGGKRENALTRSELHRRWRVALVVVRLGLVLVRFLALG